MVATPGAGRDTGEGHLASPAGVDAADAVGLHVDLTATGDGSPYASDGYDDGYDTDPAGVARFGPLESLVDAFIEAFNAHDLERSRELLADDVELPGVGGDVEGFADVVTRCWEERPHAILTRGMLPDVETARDGQPVAILWDVGDEGGWTRSGVLTFDVVEDDEIGLIEYVGDPTIIDQVESDDPEPDLPEGASWREWDEGAELV